MKLTTNTPQVNRNTINARVQAAGSMQSYGADQSGAMGTSRMLGGLAAEAQKIMIEEDTSAVMDAVNAANNDLLDYFNGENGVYTKKGVNAEGIYNQTESFVNKTYEKYASQLGSNRRVEIFKRKFNPNAYNYLRSAGSYEREQHNIAEQNRYETALWNNQRSIMMNYRDPEAVDDLIRDSAEIIQVNGQRLGLDEATIMRNKIGAATELLKAPINDAIEKGNYQDAENLLNRYKGVMDPVVYSELNNQVTDIRTENAMYQSVASMVDMCTGADGYVNTSQLYKMIEESYGPENASTVPVLPYELPVSAGDNPDIEDLSPQLRNSLGMIGGIINQLGFADTAEITSGYRDKERNAAAGGAENSYHTTGNAVDIYLGKNLSEADQNRVKAAFQPYFGEVLYHDAGSGLHLHLADYKNNLQQGSTLNGGFNAKQYKQIRQLATARANDINRAKKEEERQYKQNLAFSIYQAPTEEEAISIINKSNLSAKDKITLINEQKRLRDPSNYMSTEEAYWYKYVQSGNYQKDADLMDEYNRSTMDSDIEITPEKQTKFNKAARKLNAYFLFVDPNYKTSDYNQDYSQNADYQKMLEGIELMAERGATKAQITEYIKGMAEENNFDLDYILRTTQWDKLGKIEGGVK